VVEVEAATAEAAVVDSTEEVSAVAVSTGAVFMVVDSMEEASAVALSTAVVVSTGDISPVAVSMAVALVVAVFTVVAFVATVLVITDFRMMSSSAASAFLAGGDGVTRTDTTITAIIRTITMATDTAATHTVTIVTVGSRTTTMDIADTGTITAPVTDTIVATDQGTTGVSGDGDKSRVRLFANRSAGNACRLDRFDSRRR